MKIGVDYIGVSAGCIVYNNKNQIFMAKRGNGARDDLGKWEFPGGAIEFYETREDACRRNILEKYGFEIEIVKLLNVYDVIDKEKCSEIGWFSLEEIQNLNLSRITKLNLKDLSN